MLLAEMHILAQDADAYIVRWPSWVGAIIAFAIGTTVIAVGAEIIRRTFGRRWLWVTAGTAALGLAVFLITMIQREAAASEQPLAFASAIVTVAVLTLGPAYGVDLRARRPGPTFVRQVRWGILIGTGIGAAALLLFLLIISIVALILRRAAA